MKAGFIASSGGHWEEIMCLKPLFKRCDCFFVTETGGQARDSNLNNLYEVPQINRHELSFIIKYVMLWKKAKKIIDREKPDVIITTGALIAYPICKYAKKKGARLVYIESFARVRDASLTGKLLYPISDLFLVQWEELLKVYPKAKYVGGIF